MLNIFYVFKRPISLHMYKEDWVEFLCKCRSYISRRQWRVMYWRTDSCVWAQNHWAPFWGHLLPAARPWANHFIQRVLWKINKKSTKVIKSWRFREINMHHAFHRAWHRAGVKQVLAAMIITFSFSSLCYEVLYFLKFWYNILTIKCVILTIFSCFFFLI